MKGLKCFNLFKIIVIGWFQISYFQRTQKVIKHTIWITDHAFPIKLILSTVFLKQVLLVVWVNIDCTFAHILVQHFTLLNSVPIWKYVAC